MATPSPDLLSISQQVIRGVVCPDLTGMVDPVNPAQGVQVLATLCARMASAGFNTLQLTADWARPHSALHEFDWSDFDKSLETIQAHGLGVIVTIATRHPPAWAARKFPEGLLPSGDVCPSHPELRHARLDFFDQCVRRYATHPALLLWQPTTGEPPTACHCPWCLNGYITWLQEQYATFGALVRAWQAPHRSWSELQADQAALRHSPDWKKYQHALQTAELTHRCKVIRQLDTQHPVIVRPMADVADADWAGLVDAWALPYGPAVSGSVPIRELTHTRLTLLTDVPDHTNSADIMQALGDGVKGYLLDGSVTIALESYATLNAQLSSQDRVFRRVRPAPHEVRRKLLTAELVNSAIQLEQTVGLSLLMDYEASRTRWVLIITSRQIEAMDAGAPVLLRLTWHLAVGGALVAIDNTRQQRQIVPGGSWELALHQNQFQFHVISE